MTSLSLNLPVVGQPDSTEDPKVTTALQTIQSWGNGNIDATNITAGSLTAATLDSTTVTAILGLNASGTVRRGKVNTTATETRTNTAYGLMTTPDRVQSVVLPTDGLIAIAYQATWNETVQGAARAAIFIGLNQLKNSRADLTSPGVQEATISNAGAVSADMVLASGPLGITSLSGTTPAAAYTGDVTTGETVGGGFFGTVLQGGPCYIFAAAGTYDVSVQFKASSGSVNVKNRRLWVWSLAF